MRAHKLKIAYSIAITLFTIALAVAYVAVMADLYYDRLPLKQSGVGNIFVMSIVFDRIKWLFIPLGLYVLLAVGGFILALLYPEVEKRRVKKDDVEILASLKRRMPSGNSEEFSKAKKQYDSYEYIRLGVWIFIGVFWILAAVMSLVYLLDLSHYGGENFNEYMLKIMQNVLPWLASAIILSVAAVIFEGLYVKKQLLPRMKNLLVLGKGMPLVSKNGFAAAMDKLSAALNSETAVVSARLVVLALGVVFTTLGIFNDGIGDVLTKAINICTECIGLG